MDEATILGGSDTQVRSSNHNNNNIQANKQDNTANNYSNDKNTSINILRNYYSQHQIDFDALLSSSNGQDTSIQQQQQHRFIRLNPCFNKTETLKKLTDELEVFVSKSACNEKTHLSNYPALVTWLDESFGFYAIPGRFSLSQSSCFQEGRIYGQDVNSGAAVAALLTDWYDKKSNDKSENGNENSSKTTRSADNSALDHESVLDVATQVHTTSTEGNTLRVLDLCCAPGAKLCAIFDWLTYCSTSSISSSNVDGYHKFSNFVVTGVDVSMPRLNLTKKTIKKYCIDTLLETRQEQQTNAELRNNKANNTRIRVYHADGTTFGRDSCCELVFDSQVATEESQHQQQHKSTSTSLKRKRMNKSARSREQKQLKALFSWDWSTTISTTATETELAKTTEPDLTCGNLQHIESFDRILVDAECSTDGSIKHVQKLINSNNRASLLPRLTNINELDELVSLQKKLIESAYNLLKPGGYIVYSTCSLSARQNEEVVAEFVANHQDVDIIPLSFIPNEKELSQMRSSSLEGAVRFTPNVTRPTSVHVDTANANVMNLNFSHFTGEGFFIAKLYKNKK